MQFSRAPNLPLWLGLLDLLIANAAVMRHRSSTTREAYETQLPTISWDIFSSQQDLSAMPIRSGPRR